jgi:hypothetical protein
MSESEGNKEGGCLCRAVRYRLEGPLRPVVACHCGQCLKTHGHYAAYTALPKARLHLTEESGLAWFESSAQARRGFCRSCGASLFWERREGEGISVAAGTLDQPSGLKLIRHIFVADKGDYYELDDGLEQFPGTMGS